MIVVNQDDCIKCGACEGTCPSSAIEVGEKQIIFCDTCGGEPKCAEVCPNGALTVDEVAVDDEGNTQIRLSYNPVLCDQCGGEPKCVDVCPPKTLKLNSDSKIPIDGFCVMCKQCVDICPVGVIGIPGVKEPAVRELNISGPIFIQDCVGCGTCVPECPAEAITLPAVGESISIDETKCIKCGVCSQTCPWNAVFISENKPVKRSKTIKSFTLDESVCIGCNTCVEACPGDFIEAKGASLSVKLPQSCAACSLCEQLCPVDAISLEVEFGEATPADALGISRDVEKCDFTGACAIACPTEAIKVVSKMGMKLPEQVESDEEPSFVMCARCGACAAACPNGALTLDEFEVTIDGESVLRNRIQANPSKCEQCGTCIAACPYDMLKFKEEGNLPVVGFCTLCGQCIEACPRDAVCLK
ncbi:MAG: 4Fe-4S binding protein [Methanobrevibacter sp.]